MKNSSLYLTGQGFSALGDGLQAITVNWMVLKFSGSPLAVGGNIAITYLPPLLLAPLAGAIADNRDSRRLAVAMDIIRCCVTLLMTLMIFLNHFSLWLYYLLQFILAFSYLFYKPASQTLIKESFFDHQLASILGKASSWSNTMSLVGSALAGFLISVLPPYVSFLLNALTFLVSATCNAYLKRVQQRPAKKKRGNYWQNIKNGWNYLITTKGMLYITFLSVISSAALQMNNTLQAPFVKMYLGGSSNLFAVIDIAFTVGGLLAGICVNKALKKWKQSLCLITLIGMGIMSFLLGFRFSLILIILSFFGLGFFTLFHLVTMQVFMQVNTPKEILGSVSGLRSIVASLTKITSALSTGYFLSLVDIKYVFWGFVLIVILTLFTSGKVKHIPLPESVFENKAA